MCRASLGILLVDLGLERHHFSVSKFDGRLRTAKLMSINNHFFFNYVLITSSYYSQIILSKLVAVHSLVSAFDITVKIPLVFIDI